MVSPESTYREWVGQLMERRREYAQLVEKHTLEASSLHALDPLQHNPLTLDEGSPWQRYFEDNELRRVITQDVLRTYPEVVFFQRTDVQQRLVRLLFVYAREHPHISYKQGMHELLAPLLYLLDRCKRPHSDDPIDLLNSEDCAYFPCLGVVLRVANGGSGGGGG